MYGVEKTASILPDIHKKLSKHPIFMGSIRTAYSVQQTPIEGGRGFYVRIYLYY